jgi:hypothetical protein
MTLQVMVTLMRLVAAGAEAPPIINVPPVQSRRSDRHSEHILLVLPPLAQGTFRYPSRYPCVCPKI